MRGALCSVSFTSSLVVVLAAILSRPSPTLSFVYLSKAGLLAEPADTLRGRSFELW